MRRRPIAGKSVGRRIRISRWLTAWVGPLRHRKVECCRRWQDVTACYVYGRESVRGDYTTDIQFWSPDYTTVTCDVRCWYLGPCACQFSCHFWRPVSSLLSPARTRCDSPQGWLTFSLRMDESPTALGRPAFEATSG